MSIHSGPPLACSASSRRALVKLCSTPLGVTIQRTEFPYWSPGRRLGGQNCARVTRQPPRYDISTLGDLAEPVRLVRSSEYRSRRLLHSMVIAAAKSPGDSG